MTSLPARRRTGTRLAAAALPLLALAAGCSGDPEEEDTRSAAEVLAAAKQQLDETGSVRLDLSTEELPADIDGVLEADGVASHAPAFDGNLTVLVNELTVEVPVVAVNGKVWAKLPFTKKFSAINPADYGAPDPASLMDPASGISSWLTEAQGVEAGADTRDGERVLTSYPGTLPGAAVAAVIPSADETAEFDVVFKVDEDDVLGSVDISGPFYGETGEVDYTIALSDYGPDPGIQRP